MTTQEKPSLSEEQVEDLAYYIANDRCANLSDPGTGKTPSVCVYLEYLWKHCGEKSVWVMPMSLLKKNRDELLRFTNLHPEQVMIVDGTPKQRAKQIADQRVVVWLMGFTRWSDEYDLMLTLHPTINAVAVDEIHMGYKGNNSKRTQNLYRAMRRIRKFVAMTGTLIDGRLDSAYPTIKIIEPRYYGSWDAFMRYHADRDPVYPSRIFRWKNHERLGAIFMKHTIRRTFNSVYGKQEVVINLEPCYAKNKAAEAYLELEETAMVELENSVIDGTEPGVGTIRARQILAHPELFGLNTGDWTGKDEQLLVHVEDAKNKSERFLVFSSLVPEQERIVRLLEAQGLRVGLINGKVAPKVRSELDEKFRAGELDVIVGSPKTMAVGYNWPFVNHVIFTTTDYMDSNFTQAYKRAIRGKRTQPLRVTVMLYRNPDHTDSIEYGVWDTTVNKSIQANKVDPTVDVITVTHSG